MDKYFCPICKKKIPPSAVKTDKHFPFCSRRCQLVDLGHWFDGDYSVPDSDSPETNSNDKNQKD